MSQALRPSAPARDLRAEALSGFFFLLIALVWTWPLPRDPFTTTIAMHFDQFPAAWLVHAANSYVPDGVSEWSAFPAGEPTTRLDSFLFALLAVALHGALPGLFVTNLFVLFGPPISAWAAERFAREALGARFPASLVAGLAFGFSPLALVGVLEGHVYYLLNPWLPLLALHAWRTSDGVRGSLTTAALWTLCLLTTAYMGVNGLVIIGAIFLHRRRIDRVLVVAIAVVGLAYTAIFLAGHGATGRDTGDALARLGAASLTTLVAWDAWMDLNRHSLAPAIGLTPLCLALLAPMAKSWRGTAGRTSRMLLALGLACLILAIGPVLEFGVNRTGGVPTLLYPLLKLGLFDVYRFPIRFAWVSALMLGGLGALVVSEMSRGWQAAFVTAGMVDALVLSGDFFRVHGHPSRTPSAYARLPAGAVLDLYPEVGGAQEDIGFFQQNLSCYYQVSHRHPIYERCLNTDLTLSPRRKADALVHDAILSGGDVLAVLHGLGAKSVVAHLDVYQPFERGEVINRLNASLGGTLSETTDGGEWLMTWGVP